MLGTMADEEIDAQIFAQAVQRYMGTNSRKLLHYPTKANGEMRNCVNTNLLFTTQITVKDNRPVNIVEWFVEWI